MTEHDKENQVTTMQDLLAGGIAGSVSVCVGHPFDTYKVRLQTSMLSSPSTAAFGGFRSLFRGMGPPLSTAAVCNALTFGSYGASSRIWDNFILNRNENDALKENTDHSSWKKSMVCGAFAGVCTGLVTCPMEHIKCRLQVQHAVGCSDHIYKGPLDAFDKILNRNGIRGLYRGVNVTMIREVPAFAVYFSTYDSVKRYVTYFVEGDIRVNVNDDSEYREENRSSHSWVISAIAGGFSGSLTWAMIYPFDVIKTHIQTSPMDLSIKKRRILYVGRHIVSQHGWRHLFRGLGVTLLRAFPVNGIIFPVYEFSLIQMKKNGVLSNDGIVLKTTTS